MIKKKIKDDCASCEALCCRNLSMMIGKPETPSEVEDLRWQLHFDTVKVYIRNRRWYQLVEGNCSYLDDNNRCTIYADRPNKCRRYNPPECELYGEFHDTMLSTPEDLDLYLKGKRVN